MSAVEDYKKLQSALALHQKGDLAAAGRLYRQLTRKNPNNFQALHLLGLVEAAAGNIARAKPLMARSLSIEPPVIGFYENYARMLSRANDHAAAVEVCEKGLRIDHGNATMLHISAISLVRLGRLPESLTQFDRLVAHVPNHAAALNERGSVLAMMDRHEAAIASFDKALALDPRLAEAHLNKGTMCALCQRLDEALAAYDAALSLRPQLADAWLGRGNVLAELSRYREASVAYDKALAIQGGLADAWLGHGNVLFRLQRYDEALAAYAQALARQPGLANAWLGRGNVLEVLRQSDEALAAYDRALLLQPDMAEAWFGRGKLLYGGKRYDEAIAAFDRALALQPALPELRGIRLDAKLHVCDWQDFDGECRRLISAVEEGSPATPPFCLLAVPASAELQLKCAQAWSARNVSAGSACAWRGDRLDHDRIGVAYLSADFRAHPVSVLAAGLFETHDRSRFRTIAISLGPDDGSPLRKRIEGAFEQFVDAHGRSDDEIARLVKDLQVDILVDLAGYTGGARTGVLARRPAPIQVNYLGYAGTMGVDYIDYIIGDPIVIPEGQRQFYAEQIVCMPDSFLVNDCGRGISERSFSRAELGLPTSGFVYCCFNSHYKILPQMLDVWSRILGADAGSVLWLSEDNATSAANLRREAAARGIDPARLVFAGRLPDMAEHLARHRCADLFLDTLPYNAHSSASDALWSGLPVLTCVGETFAGRVAASLLNAIDLRELITTTVEEYEQLAIDLGRHAGKLDHIKRRLSNNRLTTPLFDTRLFTTHIETAYAAMYRRLVAGLPPQHILLGNL